MDYSIKFWDIRNLNNPIDGIFNNSHWIWNLKFNKTYSRIFVTCSSSSLVRGYLFDMVKKRDKNIHKIEENSNLKIKIEFKPIIIYI